MYNQEINKVTHFNPTKLVLLGVISLILCMSFIMSIFTPFSIAMAVVIYGRTKGYGLGLVTWLTSFILSFSILGNPTVFFAYTISLVIAILIAEIVQRQISPVKGMVKAGSTIVAVLGILFVVMTQVLNVDLKDRLTEQIKSNKEILELQEKELKKVSNNSSENFEAMAMLKQPEVLATEVLKEAPSYFFVGTFLVIWVNLFLLLRSHRIFSLPGKPRFTEKDLLKIKVPDHFIWVVIIALVLAIWGEPLGSAIYSTVGINILKSLGVFYFFQGFGIYLDFLDFARISGFLRTVLIMITIFTAAQFIAFAGLFDMFVNFRRFFKRNKNEGEK